MTATTEPTRITAGDTVAWTKTLADYPASAGWVLKYRLINAAGKIDITGGASGDDHAISVPASTSAGWDDGTYSVQSYVEKGAERHTVGACTIVISPNLAAQAGGLETRSSARKILDALLLAYEAAATSRAFVQEYEIAGRRMKFNDKGAWLTEINFWKHETAKEVRAERIAAGLGSGNKVLVRF